MITQNNIVRHELIGLDIKVLKSKNPLEIGLEGTVIDETRQTLKIEQKKLKGEKTLIKKNCIFVFTLPNQKKVEVDGKILVARPEDRIKKKFKKW